MNDCCWREKRTEKKSLLCDLGTMEPYVMGKNNKKSNVFRLDEKMKQDQINKDTVSQCKKSSACLNIVS